MKRILLVVAYDGTNYSGWQVQPNAITIESVLNEALSDLLKEPIVVSGASRTDSGVHAYCNLAVFDTRARIPGEKISYAINQRIPGDIVVRRSLEVPLDFHPRFCETEKTYEYRIWNDSFPMPEKSRYSFFSYYDFDVKAMQQAANYLVGEHDFKSFCSVGTQALSTVREVTEVSVIERPLGGDCSDGHIFTCKGGREIIIRVKGKGFLYNMVRIIAGTLMEVGRGAMEPSYVAAILDGLDRNLAGPTAPACGLTLSDYRFCNREEAEFLFEQ